MQIFRRGEERARVAASRRGGPSVFCQHREAGLVITEVSVLSVPLEAEGAGGSLPAPRVPPALSPAVALRYEMLPYRRSRAAL